MIGLRITERMAGQVSFGKDLEDFFKLSGLEINEDYGFEFSIHAFFSRFSYPFQFDFEGEAQILGAPRTSGPEVRSFRPKIVGKMYLSHKGVSYRFFMNLPGLGKVRFKGEKEYYWKDLDFKKIKKGLIHLPFELEQNGREIGKGDLNYLGPLLTFWINLSLCRSSRAFHPHLNDALRAYSWAQILATDMESWMEKEEFLLNYQRQLSTMSWWMRWGLFLSHYLLFAICLWRYRKTPKKLDHVQREVFLMLMNRNRIFHKIFLPYATHIQGATFHSEKFLKQVDQQIIRPPKIDEEREYLKLNQIPSKKWGEDTVEVDAIIVGSGAGGSAIAMDLASKGHAVAIVEEGQFFKRPDMNGRRLDMMDRLYRNHGRDFAISNSALWLPTGKCVGGTTAINSGTAMRPNDRVLQNYKDELGPDYDLTPFYERLENWLKVGPTEPGLWGGVEEVFKRGKNKDVLEVRPLNRVESGCDGQSYCIFGCPSEAKQATNVSLIPEALKSNAYLFSNYSVEKILMEGKKAVGVKAKVKGYGNKFKLKIKAKKVVLAAGALGTPHILYRSGLKGINSNIGHNLSIHPAINVGGLFPYEIRKKLFVPQSLGIFEKIGQNYVLEGYTLPTDSIPLAFPIWGKELKEILDQPNHFTNFAALIRDPTYGRLIFRKKRAYPYYWVQKTLLNTILEAHHLLGKIFYEGEALKVYTSLFGVQVSRSRKEFDVKMKKEFRPSDVTLSAYHPLGTCRMAKSKRSGVVDPYGEIYGLKELYVVDGSALIGPLEANPQLTIMANSLRISERIHQELN